LTELSLTPTQRRRLEAFARDAATPARIALRASIVLELARGGTQREVAARLGTSAPTVALWRSRFERGGLDALRDRPRPGRPRAPDRTVHNGDLSDDVLDGLLAAASRTISRRGFSATRVSDIAAEAGVSPAAIHYHFKTKNEILVRALLWANQQLVARLDEAQAEPRDPLTRVAQFIERTIPYPGTQRDEYLIEIDLWSQARLHPELVPAWERYQARWIDYVAEMIGDGTAAGAFTSSTPAIELAERIAGLTDGLSAQAAINATRMPPRRVRELILRFAAEQLGIDFRTLEERAHLPPL
jgi:AcrR family transcriptional regulator